MCAYVLGCMMDNVVRAWLVWMLCWAPCRVCAYDLRKGLKDGVVVDAGQVKARADGELGFSELVGDRFLDLVLARRLVVI